MKNRHAGNDGDYSQLRSKISRRFWGTAMTAFMITFVFYFLIWRNRGGNMLVFVFEKVFGLRPEDSYILYDQIFRGNKDIIIITVIIIIFFLLLRLLFKWIIQYFSVINGGIDELITDNDTEIQLPAEMQIIERKLNQVKQALKERELSARVAEQRKNDLVMYLAHDIRTPLTSVIGYLSLLSEASDMPAEQRAKYTRITLDKAYRLEKMINEFFEITRYNMQQINLAKEQINLTFMLVQLIDELTPILSANRNTSVLNAADDLIVYGDSNKLARAFNNIVKNAAVYSYPDTEIVISAEQKGESVIISFKNNGKTIPKEKLALIFDKFYRADESRRSDGGTGLGLAIAKEIVRLHGGKITAVSENETTVFTIIMPVM